MTYQWVKRIVIVLAILVGVGLLFWKLNYDQQTLRLHGHTYRITVLKTEDELQRGLSGTDSLPADRAMVFVFPRDEKWSIWMKDMNYPIDIVWLDSTRNVVHLEKNVQPSTYNAKDTEKSQLFRPDKVARYVIELASGTIERTGIAVGDPAGLPSGI
jgi:uncharacterized membrane protein (UPF0127 family)